MKLITTGAVVAGLVSGFAAGAVISTAGAETLNLQVSPPEILVPKATVADIRSRLETLAGVGVTINAASFVWDDTNGDIDMARISMRGSRSVEVPDSISPFIKELPGVKLSKIVVEEVKP